MRTPSRAPTLVTVEPIGAVTEAPAPIPVVVMYRWAPPHGDGSPHPVATVAVAWTGFQVRIGTGVWLPARDVHRIRDVPVPKPVLARVGVRGGRPADVPALALARAVDRRGQDVAVRVLLAPDTEDAEERWLLAADLVDEDPIDGP